MAEPMFTPGDRCFSHYTMKWGTIEGVARERAEQLRNGEPCGTYTTWWWVRNDDGTREMLDDADGNWSLCRVMPPNVAEEFKYGRDPRGGA